MMLQCAEKSLLISVLLLLGVHCSGFQASLPLHSGWIRAQQSYRHHNGVTTSPKKRSLLVTTTVGARRYGPPLDEEDELATILKQEREKAENRNYNATEEEEREAREREEAWVALQEAQFVEDKKGLVFLMKKVLQVQDPAHIPSILSKDIELIIRVSEEGYGVRLMESILKDTKQEEGDEASERAEMALDMILSFVEDFVHQTVQLDDQNKHLLGKIIKTMSDKSQTRTKREEAFDELLRQERQQGSLSAGFLRHIEGECERISNAPKMTTESARLLEMMRTIQTRVLEELAKHDLGEPAQVLGQLIGYTDRSERLAVLEAGLMVRGTEFAQDMHRMTQEALEGFQRVSHKADPNLVGMIKEIDQKLEQYIQYQEDSFQ